MTRFVRSVAALTLVLFGIELASLPCGPACHQAPEAADSSVDHACHEAPAQEGATQIAASPAACTHQHDLGDSPRTSVSCDRDQNTAPMPIVAVLASRAGFDRPQMLLFPQPRNSISSAGPPISLRI